MLIWLNYSLEEVIQAWIYKWSDSATSFSWVASAISMTSFLTSRSQYALIYTHRSCPGRCPSRSTQSSMPSTLGLFYSQLVLKNYKPPSIYTSVFIPPCNRVLDWCLTCLLSTELVVQAFMHPTQPDSDRPIPAFSLFEKLQSSELVWFLLKGMIDRR